jgi:hypothetical protein
MAQSESFAKALKELWHRNVVSVGGQRVKVALLIREEDWRPLEAPWWQEKQASIIGVDVDGNFFLRHCDGSVRFWSHSSKATVFVATSVQRFTEQILFEGQNVA